MEAGNTFPLGPKDAISMTVQNNRNPGPGTHEI